MSTATTTSTATATVTYRKTKTGEWVAYGPAAALAPNAHGRLVVVTKKDGTTKCEHVVRVGRSFVVNGVEMAYGYLRPAAPVTGTERCYQGHTSPQRGCHDCHDCFD